MRAFIKTRYGGPEVLHLEEVNQPPVKAQEILVRVAANSVNPADIHLLRGAPYPARFASGWRKPKNKIPGADFAGTVEAVGEKVTQFKPGDRVFGENLTGGAFAPYTVAAARACGHMPEGAGYAQMACVPIAGVSALQALVTHGKLRHGESVLINGASGGVGHFAVQLAALWGAEVTAVCSAKNAGFVQDLGAAGIIAHDQENIHRHHQKYHLVVDVFGNLTHADFRRMGERGVVVGFTTLNHLLSLMVQRNFNKFPLSIFTARVNTTDLEALALLVKKGTLKVHIGKQFTWKEIPQAISYLESSHPRGKVAMVWEPPGRKNTAT